MKIINLSQGMVARVDDEDFSDKGSGSPPKLDRATRAARAPRPPDEIVGALHDRIHPTSGRLLAAKPIATKRKR